MRAYQAEKRAQFMESRGYKRPPTPPPVEYTPDALMRDSNLVYNTAEPALLSHADQTRRLWICAFLPDTPYYFKMAKVLRQHHLLVAGSDTKTIDEYVLRKSQPNSSGPGELIRVLQNRIFRDWQHSGKRFPRLVDQGRRWPTGHVMLEIYAFVTLTSPDATSAIYAMCRLQGHNCQYITYFHHEDVIANNPQLTSSIADQLKKSPPLTVVEFMAQSKEHIDNASPFVTGLRSMDIDGHVISSVTSQIPETQTHEDLLAQLEREDRLKQGITDEPPTKKARIERTHYVCACKDDKGNHLHKNTHPSNFKDHVSRCIKGRHKHDVKLCKCRECGKKREDGMTS